MNIFEHLKNYKRPVYEKSYGDIISESNNIVDSLSPQEIMIYEHIKESDRQRLLKFG